MGKSKRHKSFEKVLKVALSQGENDVCGLELLIMAQCFCGIGTAVAIE